MTVKNIVDQVELLYGRQSHKYVIQLINDALLDVASKKQHYQVESVIDLKKGIRWYDLPADCVDIVKVEILDTNGRYILAPKLVDPHKILRADTDASNDVLK